MADLNVINANITKLADAEKVTKAVLSELSRSLLEYLAIDGTWDVAAVNRTINVCTPVNKKMAVLFFTAFLPNKFNEDTQAFGGMDKKLKDKRVADITAFLADANNDIWSWAADNVKVEAKEIDYLAKVKQAVAKALDKGHVSQVELVTAIAAGGLDLKAVIALMATAVAADNAGEATMNADALAQVADAMSQPKQPVVVGDAVTEADIPY